MPLGEQKMSKSIRVRAAWGWLARRAVSVVVVAIRPLRRISQKYNSKD